jgi:hypothetical protein
VSQIERDRFGHVKPADFRMLITLNGRSRTLPSCNQENVVRNHAVDVWLQIWEGRQFDEATGVT